MELDLPREQRRLRDELRGPPANWMTDALMQIEHELGSARHQLDRLGRAITAHGLPRA
jgi:hypothetical protein